MAKISIKKYRILLLSMNILIECKTIDFQKKNRTILKET